MQFARLTFSAVLICALPFHTQSAAFSRVEVRHAAIQNGALREPNALVVDAIRSEFKKRNAAVERATILDARSVTPRGPHIVLAEGVRQDEEFHGNFEEELLGVFLLNSEQTRIEKVLELMPTPRWRDYVIKIESLTETSVVVTGRGDTYGDMPMRWTYDLLKK